MKGTTKQETEPTLAGKPISYHPGVECRLEDLAEACSLSPADLRRATEQAIRMYHRHAAVHDNSHWLDGRRINIFTLSLGSAQMYYTVERREVMVRGYTWEIYREPLDDMDGGVIFIDASWS